MNEDPCCSIGSDILLSLAFQRLEIAEVDLAAAAPADVPAALGEVTEALLDLGATLRDG
jgi:hypothetical protein